MKEADNIDKLLKQKLSNYSGMKPDNYAYKNISRKILWLSFLDKIKIYGTAFLICSFLFFIFLHFSTTNNNNNKKTNSVSSFQKNPTNNISYNNKKNNIQNSTYNQTNNRISNDLNSKSISQNNLNIHRNKKTESNNQRIITKDISNATEIKKLTIENSISKILQIAQSTNEKTTNLSDTFYYDKNDNIIKNYKQKETLAKKIKNKLSVEVSMNLYNINKEISANQYYKDNINARNQTESSINILSSELELRYDFKHFFMQTGLSLMTYGESANYSITNKYTDILKNTYWKDTLVFSGGNWVYDSVLTTSFDTININQIKKYHFDNHYKYIEIPVLIGHSIMIKRFSFDISTGISAGILIETNAHILDNDNNSLIYIDEKNNPILNKFMLNYLLRFSCRYNITNNFSLFLRSSGKTNILNLFDNSRYQINQRYNALGIGLGINYKF